MRKVDIKEGRKTDEAFSKKNEVTRFSFRFLRMELRLSCRMRI